MTFTITFPLNRRFYQMTVERIPSPEGCMRFKVYSKYKYIILEKDTSRNNIPWKLIEGSYGAVKPAELMDAIRAIGAAIERELK